MVAETCGSNTVVTQKHMKTIICLKSVMACLILLGHECNKVMDKVICLAPLPKAFFLWLKKVPKPWKNKCCKVVSTLHPTSYRVKTSNKLPSTKPKQQVRISCKRPNESERRHREKYKRRNARNITTFLREPWQR